MREEINFNSDEKTSFEVSGLLVSFGSTHVRAVIEYRPPHLEDHPITTDVFFLRLLNTSNLSLCRAISY